MQVPLVGVGVHMRRTMSLMFARPAMATRASPLAACCCMLLLLPLTLAVVARCCCLMLSVQPSRSCCQGAPTMLSRTTGESAASKTVAV